MFIHTDLIRKSQKNMIKLIYEIYCLYFEYKMREREREKIGQINNYKCWSKNENAFVWEILLDRLNFISLLSLFIDDYHYSIYCCNYYTIYYYIIWDYIFFCVLFMASKVEICSNKTEIITNFTIFLYHLSKASDKDEITIILEKEKREK